jgi:sugar phosphate isomerase/epimerase
MPERRVAAASALQVAHDDPDLTDRPADEHLPRAREVELRHGARLYAAVCSRVPMIHLGVDTLCWHLRLEQGAVTVEDVLEQAADLGAAFVQVNLHHVREREVGELRTLTARAEELGLRLLVSGDFLGEGRNGDTPAVGIGRVRTWLERSVALESPILRVVSGFYRADLMGRPELIEAERRYVVSVLHGALPYADAAGVTLLLENHSDFTVDEYRSLVAEAGGSTGVFLDLINPIAALDDPVPVVRALAPLAQAGHVKDYVFESIPTDDGYHRRGFSVRYRYPGEGVADLPLLIASLQAGLDGRDFHLSVEGLDNRGDADDQRERLAPALALVRSLVS